MFLYVLHVFQVDLGHVGPGDGGAVDAGVGVGLVGEVRLVDEFVLDIEFQHLVYFVDVTEFGFHQGLILLELLFD